jgi:NTE family protein
MIKNLVFKGGGVLGIAYAGALKVLEENGILQNIERVAGTSAGSIVATLVALKYNADEIYGIVNKLNFKSFEDGWNPLREITADALYKGSFALQWLEGIVEGRVGIDATFTQLKDKGFLDLSIIATNLRTRDKAIFSFDTTPSYPVSLSSRASMAIPYFFEPVEFPGDVPDTLYVDGGVMWNYAISIFDDKSSPEDTLGLYLHDINCQSNYPIKKGDFLKYTGAVIDSLLSSQDVSVLGSPSIMGRTVMIDDLGISAVEFDLTDEQKTNLYNSGVSCMTEYLKANNLIKCKTTL